MDGADVSLAIRRARRSGAKALDLSHRGLHAWPDGIFGLRQLESLDLSGNELAAVDEGLAQLELLEELNLSHNRLETLPDLDPAALQRLRSLVLDGNPVASRLASTTVRQLASPPRTPGQTPAQVIATLLAHAGRGESAPSRSAAPPSDNAVTAFDDVTPMDGAGPAPAHRRPNSASVDIAKLLAPDADDAAPWRKEQRTMLKEVERLQARVKELEEAAASQGAPARGGGDSSLPAWLREDSSKSSLSATLPSRQRGMVEDDAAAEVRSQLREEQRRTKRLEKEVQKLSERLTEQDMKKGSVGSVPHFEFSEVDLGDIMAQGGFSVVHKGYWHTTKIALKKLFDPNINEELLAEFDNEVQKLEQIRHPNILMLLAVHRKPPALSMITELVEGGSLYQLLHTPSSFNSASGPVTGVSQSQALEIMEYSGTAIAFLHARGIAHRDIKSQNVLLSPTYEVKLCDFGLARMKSELMTGSMQFAGTPNYMAPEIFRNQKYTENVDVWAFGTMLWEAMVVDIPFANLDPPDIRERVLAGRMLAMSSSVPSMVQNLVKACWTLDRLARPPMSEVMTSLRECRTVASRSADMPRSRPRTAQAPPSSGGGFESMGTRAAPSGTLGGMSRGGLSSTGGSGFMSGSGF